MVAGQDGLVLHWDQLDQLTIECKMCGITKDIFEKREDSFGNVKVRYIGFP